MKKKISPFVTLLVILIIAIIIFPIIFNKASINRSLKSLKSSIHDGLDREIIVYDAVGNEVFRQEGKFDIEYADGRIMYDDEHGQRHIIYFENGIVIVNEIDKH